LDKRFLFAKQDTTPDGNGDQEEERRLEQKHRITLQEGLDEGVKIKEVPANWQPPARNIEAGEPAFEEVDNPGNWCEFVFRPKFTGSKANKKYSHHALPAGAQPVPKNESGWRMYHGWEFFYDGCESIEDVNFRDSATTENMIPESRKGSLDSDTLEKLGLTKERMRNEDALFWYQLLLPIHDTKRSGITDDPRASFYSDVEAYTQSYTTTNGYGGSYGHKIDPVMLPELIHFHGALIRDGVKGGSNGGIHRRWSQGSSAYDIDIANTMTLTRFHQIKRVIKLNNNLTAAKSSDEPGYDPAYKLAKLFDVLVHNTNAVTKTADLDLCGDESTWGFMGYGERGSGLVSGIVGKPGVSRGGQFVLVSDAYSFRPRVIIHRHKLHHRPPGFTMEGPNEVRMVADILEGMVQKVPGDGGIFRTYPHMTWDNYFSGDSIMDYLGKKGFGATMTCRRDRFPEKIPKKYFHHERGQNDKRNKVARYLQPITAVKSYPPMGDAKAYTRTHVSLQSTGSTNFCTVNALNSNRLFLAERNRGIGDSKKRWAIEMCEARYLYLKTYGTIDTIDAMIKKCNIAYRSRKYWHSAMNHGISLVVVVAYDMYKEAASGSLRDEWKVEKPMDFHQFRDRLSGQMLKYDPRKLALPGDEKIRVSTKVMKRKRPRKHGRKESKKGRLTSANVATGGIFCVATEEYSVALESGRLCKHMYDLAAHLASFTKKGVKSGRNCHWCGETAYTKCAICDVPLHNFPTKGDNELKPCSVHFHDPDQFGLAYMDSKTCDSKKGMTWVQPSRAAIVENRNHINGSVVANI